MKVYKSSRAKAILEREGEKFVRFGKDENGFFILSTDENEQMIERRLSFTDDCIIIKSYSIGTIKFIAEQTTEKLEIFNG